MVLVALAVKNVTPIKMFTTAAAGQKLQSTQFISLNGSVVPKTTFCIQQNKQLVGCESDLDPVDYSDDKENGIYVMYGQIYNFLFQLINLLSCSVLFCLIFNLTWFASEHFKLSYLSDCAHALT